MLHRDLRKLAIKGGEYLDTSVKNKKLRTLPWYALLDIAVKKGIEEKEVNGKEKNTIIDPLLSTSGEGQEIIRQFVEQGMIDARCQIIAVVIPQYIDAGFKGTLRHLARLSGKKVTFIELDELSELISINKKILVS